MTLKNTRAYWSNPTIISPMSKPKRFIRETNAKLSFETVYHSGDETSLHTAAKAPIQSLAEAFKSSDSKDCNPSALATIAFSTPPGNPNDDSSNTAVCEYDPVYGHDWGRTDLRFQSSNSHNGSRRKGVI